MDQQEWEQLLTLREALNNNLMAYDVSTQERFTELLVKSLEGKGDRTTSTENRPLRIG
jgi:hypothetical protein